MVDSHWSSNPDPLEPPPIVGFWLPASYSSWQEDTGLILPLSNSGLLGTRVSMLQPGRARIDRAMPLSP